MRQLTAPDAIHVSQRFRLTLESSILDLEAAAARDERLLPHWTTRITSGAKNCS